MSDNLSPMLDDEAQRLADIARVDELEQERINPPDEIEAIKQAAHALTTKQQKEGYSLDPKHGGAVHVYRDEDCFILYARFRLKHANGDKFIRPIKRNDRGAWVMGEPAFTNGKKPLYNLNELHARPTETIYLVEGERCADFIMARELLATTSGGSSSDESADWNPLAGREIIIWPDSDQPGLDYRDRVTSKLHALGCKVQHVDIAKLNLPPKGDAVDWLKSFADTHGRKATADDIRSLPRIDAPQDAIQSVLGDLIDAGDRLVSTTPEPLPELPSVLPFDYDYLPKGLRTFVKDISERMQCPPDFAAVGAFVMMATIIGRKVCIKPMRRDDWTVTPNLWGAVVGNSGVMKSPTLSASLSPIKKLQNREYEMFNSAMSSHAENEEVAKLRKSVNTSAAKKALKEDSSANVFDLLDAGNDLDKPILKRFLTNNASYEALGELLIENPNGLLIESDEIIGLLKQLDASGQEVARSFYLTAADGDKSYTFDRIIRGKGLHIPALCLSVIGGIQPGVLAEYVRQATGGGAGADGLLQRFGLMVYPDISTEWCEVDRYPDSAAKESVNLLAEKLDTLDYKAIGARIGDYGGVPFLNFDDKAQALFSEWRAKLEHRLRSGDEHPAIVSHLSKYRKLIPTLALINHLCDAGHGAVNEAALLRAIAFSEYLESHARRIYSYATRPDIDAAKTLLKRLAGGKVDMPFKARDIYIKGWTGLETAPKAQAAIDLLLEYNHLTQLEINTGGRPTRVYMQNKGVL
jgi:putative DNA primase/helicase